MGPDARRRKAEMRAMPIDGSAMVDTIGLTVGVVNVDHHGVLELSMLELILDMEKKTALNVGKSTGWSIFQEREDTFILFLI